MERRTTLTGVLVGILAVAVSATVAEAFFWGARERANRARCASNLRQIGMACMTYAAAHRQRWPDVFGEGSTRWDDVGNTRTDEWDPLAPAPDPEDGEKAEPPPFGDNNKPAQSNTASLYVLLRANIAGDARIFICPSSANRADAAVANSGQARRVRDFRGEPCISYSYQNVLGDYKVTSTQDPQLAVAADANPMRRDYWSGPPDTEAETDGEREREGDGAASARQVASSSPEEGAKAPAAGDEANADPDAGTEPEAAPRRRFVTDVKLAQRPSFSNPAWGRIRHPWELNSPNHAFAGQNVLYLDGYVEWRDNPYCGFRLDNIWCARKGALIDDKTAPPTVSPDPSDIETLRAWDNGGSYDGTSRLGPALRDDSFLVP